MTDQEINEEVAKRLAWKDDRPFGWIQPDLHKDGFAIGHASLPDYCHDIKAAWEIVEYIQTKDIHIALFDHLDQMDGWIAEMRSRRGITLSDESADTAPMAICLAFLKMDESTPSQTCANKT